MEIDFYNLFCSRCDTPRFILFEAIDVEITLDLENDMLIFRTTCPTCDNDIYNSRPRKGGS